MPNLLDWGQPVPANKPQSEPLVTATVVAKQTSRIRSGRTNPGRRHGEHGTGPRSYTPGDVEAVRRALAGTSEAHPISIAQLAAVANLNGRTVRSVISERDGIDFLVGCAPTGELFDATEAPNDASGFTIKLESQIKKMASRVRRRNAFHLARLNALANGEGAFVP